MLAQATRMPTTLRAHPSVQRILDIRANLPRRLHKTHGEVNLFTRRGPGSGGTSWSDRHHTETHSKRSTGSLVLGLLLRNWLPYFTSCLIELRLVTEFVTREAPRLTRSGQVEAGTPKKPIQRGL